MDTKRGITCRLTIRKEDVEYVDQKMQEFLRECPYVLESHTTITEVPDGALPLQPHLVEP